MRYMVIGLVNNQASKTLTVAAVIQCPPDADEIEIVDEDTNDETAQRWADVVDADSPDAAEREAQLLVWGMED